MTDLALKIDNIIAGYGDTVVLNNISFDVLKGERLAIIGRNGVGKTTLLATIMGLTNLHSGSIEMNAKPIINLPTHMRAKNGLGFVPQTRDIFPSLSVEENLISGIRGDASLEEAYELFPRLKERRSNGGGTLSGGEQQMLAIARTLLGKPDVLLLDEPLEGLAPVICEMLMDVFEQIAKTGSQTVVLVEQHTGLAVEFADRVIILDGGEIVHAGSSQELIENPGVLERHVGVGLMEAN